MWKLVQSSAGSSLLLAIYKYPELKIVLNTMNMHENAIEIIERVAWFEKN